MTHESRSIADAWARHRERHRATGFGFALADSIDFLDAEAWDAVTKTASRFIHRDYLRVLESDGPIGVQQRYALIFKGRKPVAAIAAQLIDVQGKDLVPEAKPGFVNAAQRFTLSRLHARALICGDLVSCGPHGTAFAPGENPVEITRAVAEALYRIRRADKLSGQPAFVLWKEEPIGQVPGIETLARYSYRPVKTDPNMVLALDPAWTSFEDYLASLNTKYRKAARKVLKSIDESGCQIAPILDMQSESETLHKLYTQVRSKAQARLAMLAEGFLPEVGRAFGPSNFRCTGIRLDGTLVGFVTTLRDGDTAIGFYLGYDESARESLPLYRRLLYAVIEDAIELGCRHISFGRTSLEPKSRLGAQPVPMRVWLRHRVPAINAIVRELLLVVPETSAPDRSPFKKGAEPTAS